jgi:DNA-directed RNA polymerase subunit alpha
MRIRWRGLELPSKVAADKETASEVYGKFVAEPFERGFGNTIGNSLRRVLLSSLEGSAVTRIRIKNALHEFTPLKGVLEDVTEICLNIKSLVVRNHDEKPKVLRISKSTKGPITARDIQTDHSVNIVNPDHHIATLTDDVEFEVEMVVENDRGYIPASERAATLRERGDEVGFIHLDAAFSPVTRVRYAVEETRVGQKTNFDKLTIEIWTDGSLLPELALVEAAKILRKHLNPFLQYDRLDSFVYTSKPAKVGGTDPAVEAKLAMGLAELGRGVRANNCLEQEKILTLRDLVSRSEDSLLDIRNFGENTLNEVKEKLTELGLRLGMRVPPPSSPYMS